MVGSNPRGAPRRHVGASSGHARLCVPCRYGVVGALVIACALVQAAPRSSAVRAEFKRSNPCPSTGRSTGPCPGFVIDHIEPLCASGADAPHNMAWQTRADSLRKDTQERALCRSRSMKKGDLSP
jgi:hypothetical protein